MFPVFPACFRTLGCSLVFPILVGVGVPAPPAPSDPPTEDVPRILSAFHGLPGLPASVRVIFPAESHDDRRARNKWSSPSPPGRPPNTDRHDRS